MLLKAQWVVPVSSSPIHQGAVQIKEGHIEWVGSQTEIQKNKDKEVLDLGRSILLPGLVNAHAHLEHARLEEKMPEGFGFAEWAKQMGGESPPLHHNTITSLLRGGTTTLADHQNPEAPSPKTPFRRIIFWEVLGSNLERARQSFEKAKERCRKEGGFVSPHSLYGVHSEILDVIAKPNLFSIHLLESSDENEFFRNQSGPLMELVRERGGKPFLEMSPVKWLAQNVGAQSHGDFFRSHAAPLLVHCNYLTDDEIDLVKEMGAGIVHCPGSHQFFGHQRFPLEKILQKGIPVALGTDSLASNEDLSMLREIRLLRNPPSPPFVKGGLGGFEILKMATLNGARLLNRENDIGTLEAGKKADLIAVPITDPEKDPYENIGFAHSVCFSMIEGEKILCTNP